MLMEITRWCWERKHSVMKVQSKENCIRLVKCTSCYIMNTIVLKRKDRMGEIESRV